MNNSSYNALYARQSVEKKDSISVESQLEYCRYEAHGEHCLEYTDKGFSGKDTNRPAFENMMQDIRAGKIKRVIVYKLDRISRSILDFANMMALFQKYHVEFISSTEKFDTSTPIGRAMLNICIVFAQLERETIQKRVTDAYYARCRRGFYMGGRVPYGYCLTDTIIENIHTSMYAEVPEESSQIKLIYSMYAASNCSLGDIVRYLNAHQIKHLRGAAWNTARISELLPNPVYVQADEEVYRFFQSQGANLYNPISDYTGSNACYLYKISASKDTTTESAPSKSTAADTRKHHNLSEKEVILAPHKGFITPQIWLACRRRCQENQQFSKSSPPKNSWLAGKIKCGNCGYALIIRKAKTKWKRYFVCSQSGTNKICQGTGCTIYADVLEDYLLAMIQKRLSAFPTQSENPPQNQHLRIAQIEQEIDSLLSKTAQAGETFIKYIDKRISALDTEKNILQKELETLATVPKENARHTSDRYAQLWEQLPFAARQEVVDIFIQSIRIANGTMEIIWNI